MSVTNLNVEIFVLSDRNATVVQASARDVSVTGASKREQGDIYDQDIATDLAVSRALDKLSRQLRRRANAKVRQAMEEKTA